jgi:hypothetical protein
VRSGMAREVFGRLVAEELHAVTPLDQRLALGDEPLQFDRADFGAVLVALAALLGLLVRVEFAFDAALACLALFHPALMDAICSAHPKAPGEHAAADAVNILRLRHQSIADDIDCSLVWNQQRSTQEIRLGFNAAIPSPLAFLR